MRKMLLSPKSSLGGENVPPVCFSPVTRFKADLKQNISVRLSQQDNCTEQQEAVRKLPAGAPQVTLV